MKKIIRYLAETKFNKVDMLFASGAGVAIGNNNFGLFLLFIIVGCILSVWVEQQSSCT